MLRERVAVGLLLTFLLPLAVNAEELVKMIQKDLIALGYDPGNIQGEISTQTVVAISRFQAEYNFDVTGEATPQLAGVIKATLKQKNNPAATIASAPATGPVLGETDIATLQDAQQKCLQDKIAAKQKSEKKRKGFGSLMRAVTNTAARFGGSSDLATRVRGTTHDIYNANATAQDWEQAAEDLGLTQDELEACRNPLL
ncbi:MAG: peptidoglycan-binding domain-containing protein [Pseudomonadota bacterium]